MARRPKISRRSSASRQAARATQRKISLLRQKGLIGRTEFRGKPSGSAYKLIRKYADVIEGRATVVKPSTRLIPKHLRKQAKERRGRLVIPKVEGTVSTVIKRTKKGPVIIRKRRRAGGETVVEKVAWPLGALPILAPGEVYRVTMPNWRTSKYFGSEKTLDEFIGFSSSLSEFADIAVVELPSQFRDAFA